jgi:methionine sulfoxide reductase heme-binding subunit
MRMPSKIAVRSRVVPLLPHLAALPGLWLGWRYFSGALGFDPVQVLSRFTGDTALIMLLLSLACRPLEILSGWTPFLKWRRPLGLYAFGYAALHLFMFAYVDFGLRLQPIVRELAEKRYLWAGVPAFLILLALAATSFDWSKRWMRKNWKRLHRLVYAAGVLAVLHFGLVSKGDFFQLTGDVLRPLLAGVVLLFLLALRLGFIRRAAVRLRTFFRRPKPLENQQRR